MKKFLCIIISISILFCLCGCSNDDNTSTQSVEVIYEEEVETVYEGDNTSSEDTTTSQNEIVSSDNDVSDVMDTSKPDTSSSTGNESVENICLLNDSQVLKNIKLNGRCEKTSDGINLNMAASAIEFNTDSTSVLLEVNADTELYYTIMIDGKITAQHQAVEKYGTNYIVVARGLKGGSHNVKFIRDSESRTDLKFTAISIQLDDNAKLLSKDGDKPVIEFLGDSLTSGFGNMLDHDVANSSALEYLSATKAYPFLVANKLGYDYRIVSMSGIALGKRDGYPSFPEFYSLESYHIDKNKKYTSSNPGDVDIVVVNLGTNDVNDKLYDAQNPESVSTYQQHFADLITKTGYRKDVKVVFIFGIWQKEPITAINAAVKELNSHGYNNVYTLQLNEYKSGGGSHPSAKEHQEIADKIINFFNSNNIV